MRISDWSSDVCSSDLPAAGGTGRLHRLDGGGADLAPFGMHPVILDPVDLDRQEGAGADVQGDTGETDADLLQLFGQVRREMQAGGRRRDGTELLGEHGLIIAAVALVRRAQCREDRKSVV